MKLLTWNINGIKTLPKYHPWNTLPSFDAILQTLDADIICFQELKTSRKLLTPSTATPPSFHAFISLPTSKTGYSGVATYTRSACVIPLKAEEGLTGMLQPKPPLNEGERVSRVELYPAEVQFLPASASSSLSPSDINNDDEEPNPAPPPTLTSLDTEGRVLTLDFGLFVLINVYCPNDSGTPARTSYKSAFHALLSHRVRTLIEEEGREVIVAGDLNACPAVIDHCEGEIMVAKARAMRGAGAKATAGAEGRAGAEAEGREEGRAEGKDEGKDGEEGFWTKDYRIWLRDWVADDGPLVDVVRKFWPGRKGMYTCWNTKLSARTSNYGTRIDFILCTPGLLPWIKNADVRQDVAGSDHCPVGVEFYDEIEVEGGKRRLRDVLGVPPGVYGTTEAGATTEKDTGADREENARNPPEPPRICAKFWDEFSGRQTSLAQFFGSGKAKGTSSSSTLTPSVSTPSSSTPMPTLSVTPTSNGTPITTAGSTPTPGTLTPTPSSSTTSTSTSAAPSTTQPPSTTTTTKRKFAPEPATSTKKAKKEKKGGQKSIASFFSKPSAGSGSASSSASVVRGEGKTGNSKSAKGTKGIPKPTPTAPTPGGDTDVDMDVSQREQEEQEEQEDEDYKLALQLSLSSPPSSQSTPFSPSVSTSASASASSLNASHNSNTSKSSKTKTKTKSTKDAWSTLLAPLQPPTCRAHGEPAREYTVNKPGANKGKKFFICSRPVGPGYDMGKSERLREHVDPQYRCDFFKWASDVRREQALQAQVQSGKGGSSS